jgi:hypothetical protein
LTIPRAVGRNRENFKGFLWQLPLFLSIHHDSQRFSQHGQGRRIFSIMNPKQHEKGGEERKAQQTYPDV